MNRTNMQAGRDEETLLYYGSSSWGERRSEMAVASETLLPVNGEIEIVFPTEEEPSGVCVCVCVVRGESRESSA